MDGSRFDALTRRAFGRATSGVLAAALGIAAPVGTAGKKNNKKKKRCRKLGVACTPGGKRKCCGRFRCALTEETEDNLVKRCCHNEAGASCRSSADCCRPMGCDTLNGRCDIP